MIFEHVAFPFIIIYIYYYLHFIKISSLLYTQAANTLFAVPVMCSIGGYCI